MSSAEDMKSETIYKRTSRAYLTKRFGGTMNLACASQGVRWSRQPVCETTSHVRWVRQQKRQTGTADASYSDVRS
jgi:hypothetical protein